MGSSKPKNLKGFIYIIELGTSVGDDTEIFYKIGFTRNAQYSYIAKYFKKNELEKITLEFDDVYIYPLQNISAKVFSYAKNAASLEQSAKEFINQNDNFITIDGRNGIREYFMSDRYSIYELYDYITQHIT